MTFWTPATTERLIKPGNPRDFKTTYNYIIVKDHARNYCYSVIDSINCPLPQEHRRLQQHRPRDSVTSVVLSKTKDSLAAPETSSAHPL